MAAPRAGAHIEPRFARKDQLISAKNVALHFRESDTSPQAKSMTIPPRPARTVEDGRVGSRRGSGLPTFPRSPLSFRTASFPQYGWKAGFPSRAFLGDRRLKPAPGIRRPPSSLHPPFVHFVVATVVRSELGLRTRSCTAMRWNTPPTPGALARVRVVLSRSVIT